MGLVLCRKKGEVISLDNEVFIEISNLNPSNKALEVYIYNKTIDKESGHELPVDGFFTFKWGRYKKVKLSVKLSGKTQHKIILEADKSISIGRENRVSYNTYVDNFDNDLINEDDDYNYEDDNDVDNSKVISFSDNLVDKYKNELSWFYQ